MHLILTGATGLVGGAVLSHILSLPPSTSLKRLSILSRSPVVPLLASPPPASMPARTNTTTQIEVIHHTDFMSYPPELLERLRGAHGIIWALGVSQNTVDPSTYVRVTKDYTLAAAKAFSSLNSSGDDGPKGIFNFVYVSGEGATLKPGRLTPLFGRVKGETEAALLALSTTSSVSPSSSSPPSSSPYSQLRVYSVRPAAVDGSMQPWIWERNQQRLSRFLRAASFVLMPMARALYPSIQSPTPQLGQVLTELAMGDGAPLNGEGIEGEGRTIRNSALRRLGGLS